MAFLFNKIVIFSLVILFISSFAINVAGLDEESLETECRPYVEKALKDKLARGDASWQQESKENDDETKESAEEPVVQIANTSSEALKDVNETKDVTQQESEEKKASEEMSVGGTDTSAEQMAQPEETKVSESEEHLQNQPQSAETIEQIEQTQIDTEKSVQETAEEISVASQEEISKTEKSEELKLDETFPSVEEIASQELVKDEASTLVEQQESAEQGVESLEKEVKSQEQQEDLKSTETAESLEQPTKYESKETMEESQEQMITEEQKSKEEGEVPSEEVVQETSSTEQEESSKGDEQSVEKGESREEISKSEEKAESKEEVEQADKSIESPEEVEDKIQSEEDIAKSVEKVDEGAQSAEEIEDAAKSVEEEVEVAKSVEEVEGAVKSAEQTEEDTKSVEQADEAAKSEEEITKSIEQVEEEVKSREDTAKSAEQVEEAVKSTEEAVKSAEETEAVVKSAEQIEEEPIVSEGGEIKQAEEPAETVEDELTKEFVIPEVLRSRTDLNEILRLDEESSEIELALAKTADSTLRELKRLYDSAIKPLEILYKYRDLSNRHFGDPEIFSKPLILFMGPWSGGKSSIINYLLDNEYNENSLRTGAEPSPAYFNIVMWGPEPEILDGTQLAADWTFSGLQKFGQGLEDRLRGLKLPNKLLEKVNIVEIPGILEVRKQVSRMFPFNDACQWFIDRADVIFLVYDPTKLDVGPETEAILDQLKGREYQTRVILNKADTVKPEELLRVQGALLWNISPLMSSPQPPIIYTTSLWSTPYNQGSPVKLLQAQERGFLRDIRQAIDKRVENKIASARRFAVRVRNHAKMVDCYLTTYYNHKTFFGNRKQISDDIIENPQQYHIYEGLSTLKNISRYDLPDPDTYRDFFKVNPLYDFQPLSSTCTYFKGCPINRLDVCIAYDLPELVGKHKKLVEQTLVKSTLNS